VANGNNNGIWPIVLIVLGIALLGQLFSGNSASTSTPVNNRSPEYRYANERFKREGFSSADADEAARAVIKFHEAQKARKN
jgi:hypothetical protein